MTKENKFLPKLRFPEFEGVWKEIGLNSLLDFKNGINASKSDYGFGYKFINVLDIIENDFITHDKIIGEVNVTKEVFEKNSVQYGDILFQRSSETRDEVGQANVYLDKEKKATFGGFVIRGKKIGEYEPFFLNLLLKSSMARKEITSKSGGSTRFNVGQNILASIKLPFPLLIEQQKIASFLQEVDKKIDLLSQKITALETYKKGLMQKLFSQEIRFKQDDGSDFSDWEEKQLGKIFLDRKGKGISKSKITNDGIHDCILYGELYTRYNEVITEVHSKTNTNEGIPSKIGDLLIPSSTTTTGIDLANVTALNKPEVRLGGDIIILRSKKAINNIFYSYYLSNYKKKAIASRAQGITIVHLYFSGIKDLFIHYPCLEEQTKLANFLIAIDDKINQTQQQLQQTRTFKKGLLQQIFV